MVPGFDLFQLFEGAAFFGKDFGCRPGPHIALGGGVVAQEIVVDRSLQLRDAGERAAPDALARDLGEEALDHVEPR